MPSLNDLTGNRFGRLMVIGRSPNKGRRTMWLCTCDCGITTSVTADSLISHRTKSCGCYQSEQTRARSLKHGNNVNRKHTRTYSSWCHAKERCFNTNVKNYPNYGGRGITMCDAWINDFSAFLKDMGECPPTLTLERKDVNGNYEPSNCIWATQHQQNRNKTTNVFLEFNGRRQIMADWARELGIDNRTLHAWIRYDGLTLEEIINVKQF